MLDEGLRSCDKRGRWSVELFPLSQYTKKTKKETECKEIKVAWNDQIVEMCVVTGTCPGCCIFSDYCVDSRLATCQTICKIISISTLLSADANIVNNWCQQGCSKFDYRLCFNSLGLFHTQCIINWLHFRHHIWRFLLSPMPWNELLEAE